MDEAKHPYPFKQWLIQTVVNRLSILGLGDVAITNANTMQRTNGERVHSS